MVLLSDVDEAYGALTAKVSAALIWLSKHRAYAQGVLKVRPVASVGRHLVTSVIAHCFTFIRHFPIRVTKLPSPVV